MKRSYITVITALTVLTALLLTLTACGKAEQKPLLTDPEDGAGNTGTAEPGQETPPPPEEKIILAPSGIASPAETVPGIFGSDEALITLYLNDGSAYKTYTVAQEYYKERITALLGGYEWTELDALPRQTEDYRLTLASADGKQTLTLYAEGSPGTAVYKSDTVTACWKAEESSEGRGTAEEIILHDIYDNLDVYYGRIVFDADSAEEAADRFVNTAYGEHMLNLSPGNLYGITEYGVINRGITETAADGSAVMGWFECAVTPCDFDKTSLWAGNTEEGTGEYEGKLVYYRQFVLQRQSDGRWHCIGMGTGGCTLPE